MSARYDVVIAGAGMVGAALAAALAGAAGATPPRIALLEASEPGAQEDSAARVQRVSALSRASQRLLDSVGVWGRVSELGVSPYRRMVVWEGSWVAANPARIEFDSAEIGEPDLGHIVENRFVQRALLERLRALAGVECMIPARVVRLGFAPRSCELDLEDGRRLRARLVIGADGAGSTTRRLAGIDYPGWRYVQQALVTTITTTAPHRETAWQRFLPDGPLALLPLADGRCSIVWSTSPAHAAALLAMSDEDLAGAVTAASDGVLGDIVAVGARGSFPLQARHAAHYVRRRFALVGDAAHTVHPLAGQGANLGLADAACLGSVLGRAWAVGEDPGDLSVLRRYERQRKGANLLMLAALDGIKRLFGADEVPWGRLRRTGLGLTNRLRPAKTVLMRQALGLAAHAPSRNG